MSVFTRITPNMTGDANLSVNISTNLPEIPEPPSYIFVLAGSVYGVIFVVGILGNIIVVASVKRSQDMHTRVNYFLCNLSVADLMIIVVCMPTALVEIYSKDVWYFGAAMCKFIPFLESWVTLASVLTVIVISKDRYVGVCFPLVNNMVNQTSSVWRTLIGIWCMSGVVSIPWIFIAIYRKSTFVDGTPINVCRSPITAIWKQIYIIAIFVIFLLIPFIVILILYMKMCWHLNVHSRFARENSNRFGRDQATRQVTIMLTIVVVLLFVCLLPQRVVSFWLVFARVEQIMALGLEAYLSIITFTRVLTYIQSASNPLIYIMFSNSFRKSFRKLLFSHKRSQRFDVKSEKALLQRPLKKMLSNLSTSTC